LFLQLGALFLSGTMPSDDLFLHFQKDLHLVSHWRVNGRHYARTLQQWQKRMEARKSDVMRFFIQTYGSEGAAYRWFEMWKMFFMACAIFFGWNKGEE
jgi:cyclopropane-fatty-acyl-phospholipid synthase